MVFRRIAGWALVVLVAGPAAYQWADPHGGTRQEFNPVIETSMAPDFSSSSEPTYPIVLFHQHTFPTKDEKRNDRWFPSRTVCYALDKLAARGESAASSKAAAACTPLVETGIGWLHASPHDFADRAVTGVVASTGCDGNLWIADHDARPIVVPTTGWDPQIDFLPNGSVAVDGTWFLRPGEVLKTDYVLVGREFGDSDDRRVRVAIDFPGRWLVRNTGPMPSDPVSGEALRHAPMEVRKDFGERVANVPVETDTVESILAPLLGPSANARQLTAFRATTFDGRLTDLSLALSSEDETIEWYVGGRDATNMRMIGRPVPRSEGGIDVLQFQDAFPDPLSLYADSLGDALPVVLWWAPDHALQTTSIVPWSESWIPAGSSCDGECAFVWAAGPTGTKEWRRHPGPVVEGTDALTLAVEKVTTHDVQRLYFHRP